MNFKNIIDYNNYKKIFFFYIIFLIIITNTNLLSYIFNIDIKSVDFNLFIFSYIVFGFVFLIIYPFIKIKLLDLSKKNVNNKVLYDYLNQIKINENMMNILKKLNELIPIFFIILYLYLCISLKKINPLSYFLLFISIIFLIKMFLNYSTLLPDSSESCQVRLLNGGCNDLLCSGHFSIVFLIYLLVVKYNFINSNYNNYLLIITILYGFIPILTKKHYTIDILVAILVVLLVNNYIPKK